MYTEILRNDWKKNEIIDLYKLPFNDLLYIAHRVFREHHDPNKVQVSTLLSVKTGSCSEDCAYCPQSGHYDTGVEKERLLSLEEVREHAEAAKENGASRFCMGAAWRSAARALCIWTANRREAACCPRARPPAAKSRRSKACRARRRRPSPQHGASSTWCSAATANRGRSCRPQPCLAPTRTRATRTSTMRWTATCADVRPITASAKAFTVQPS